MFLMNYYDHFVIPFTIGVIVLAAVLVYKYVRWFVRLEHEDKRLIRAGIFTHASLSAVGEVFRESLLHRRIMKVNPLLGYMHMSLAFGWFLLIVVGWLETTAHFGTELVPPHTHIFFKFFAPRATEDYMMGKFFGFMMDLLLLFVLSGVALAWYKRFRSRRMGMRRTTKHTWGDRLALSALWFIFPARLVAESATSGLQEGTTFLTGSLGRLMVGTMGVNTLEHVVPVAWWFYSIVLALFFIALPFSRYMHIFTEVPLIFLRKYRLHSRTKESSFDHFQIEACSRCGICIDPCQLQKDAGINNVQSVYFLRDRRYNHLKETIADNCLMCGRCERTCPVGIELNTLRLNSRNKFVNLPSETRYTYLRGVDTSSGSGRVGYFAGCMTMLSPKILHSMQSIFESANEQVWWADKDGGVCCGRPLKLAGEVEAARKMVDFNRDLFLKHGITTLVTSCPICLKVFREDYNLPGIEVLHHSEYILRLIETGRITLDKGSSLYTYHDPCELGRGSGIYDQPRDVISRIGSLVEMEHTREDALCCGSSLANTAITDSGQNKISLAMSLEIQSTGAEGVVTTCPLCKKALARNSKVGIYDLSEVVASALR